jgi:hypothetical protein
VKWFVIIMMSFAAIAVAGGVIFGLMFVIGMILSFRDAQRSRCGFEVKPIAGKWPVLKERDQDHG